MKYDLYSAMPTPMDRRGNLDEASLARMIERNLAAGVSGFFSSGNMGEWSQLSRAMKVALAVASRQAIGKAGVLLAGVTETGLQETLATMKAVERRAAPDAVVVMLPPPATCRIHPITYLRAVLDAATCPVYYYHCPPVTGVQFHAGEFARLLEHPRLAGIKNSAGDIGVRKELLKLKRDFDFRLFEGHEWGIDEALIAGCDGALCGLAALAGRPMMEIVRAVERGDFRAAREAQFKMLDIYHGIYGVDTATVQNAHKYALYRLGVFATPRCRIVSDDSLSDARKAEIDATLERFRSDLA